MHLSRFGVTDYKCLGEVDVPLTPMHVLIGPNDSGKTRFLEARAAFWQAGNVTGAKYGDTADSG